MTKLQRFGYAVFVTVLVAGAGTLVYFNSAHPKNLSGDRTYFLVDV